MLVQLVVLLERYLRRSWNKSPPLIGWLIWICLSYGSSNHRNQMLSLLLLTYPDCFRQITWNCIYLNFDNGNSPYCPIIQTGSLTKKNTTQYTLKYIERVCLAHLERVTSPNTSQRSYIYIFGSKFYKNFIHVPHYYTRTYRIIILCFTCAKKIRWYTTGYWLHAVNKIAKLAFKSSCNIQYLSMNIYRVFRV